MNHVQYYIFVVMNLFPTTNGCDGNSIQEIAFKQLEP